MQTTTTATLTVSTAIVLLVNYALNINGVQPMPPDVTIAAGVVVHAIGVGVIKLFKWSTTPKERIS
jgi:hypothetical protein